MARQRGRHDFVHTDLAAIQLGAAVLVSLVHKSNGGCDARGAGAAWKSS